MVCWPFAAWKSSQPQQQAPLGPSSDCARCLGCCRLGQELPFGSVPSPGLILRRPPSLLTLDSFKFTEGSCSPRFPQLYPNSSQTPWPLPTPSCPLLMSCPLFQGQLALFTCFPFSTEVFLFFTIPSHPTLRLTSSQSPTYPDSPGHTPRAVFADCASGTEMGWTWSQRLRQRFPNVRGASPDDPLWIPVDFEKTLFLLLL